MSGRVHSAALLFCSSGQRDRRDRSLDAPLRRLRPCQPPAHCEHATTSCTAPLFRGIAVCCLRRATAQTISLESSRWVTQPGKVAAASTPLQRAFQALQALRTRHQ
eukprot:174242-Chlamydomonas_euryale.AAC.2